jgi:hypothetical protein
MIVGNRHATALDAFLEMRFDEKKVQVMKIAMESSTRSSSNSSPFSVKDVNLLGGYIHPSD